MEGDRVRSAPALGPHEGSSAGAALCLWCVAHTCRVALRLGSLGGIQDSGGDWSLSLADEVKKRSRGQGPGGPGLQFFLAEGLLCWAGQGPSSHLGLAGDNQVCTAGLLDPGPALTLSGLLRLGLGC